MTPGAVAKASPSLWGAGIAMLALCWYAGTQIQQHEFPAIATGFGALFLVYGLALFLVRKEEEVVFFVAWGLLCRFVLLFYLPQLSDDYYRFIWDGRLAVQGIHPFEVLPSEYARQGFPAPGLDQSLYEKLNSPHYYTIYPPAAQAVFAAAALLFPHSVPGSVWVMKSLLFLMEAGSLWLLWRLAASFGLPRRSVLVYAINPLVVVEITGNLHFEGAMIFFFLLALWWGVRSKYAHSAAATAISVASKMVSLLILPFLLRPLGWRRAMYYYTIFAAATLLLFAPLFRGFFLGNFAESLDLYFRRFEFNASIYYVARHIGYICSGHNRIAYIGPAMAAAASAFILLQAFLSRDKSWAGVPKAMLFAVCIYLFFSTTVHPWYICFPVAMCALTRYRFAVVWSATAAWSYHKYSLPAGEENLWLIGLEYAAVFGFLIWELCRGSSSKYAHSA